MKQQYVAEIGQRICSIEIPLSAADLSRPGSGSGPGYGGNPSDNYVSKTIEVRVASKSFTFQILDPTPGRRTVLYKNQVIKLNDLREDIHVFSVREHRFKSISELATGSTAGEIIKAPMPGKVVRILKAEGDAVQVGDGILVMEAMKMQNELKAKTSGKITKIHASEGQTVESKNVLAEIES